MRLTGPAAASGLCLLTAALVLPAAGSARSREAAAAAVAPAARAPLSFRHGFHFTRAMYGSWRFGFRGGSWATDYPKADRQFLIGVRRILSYIDAYAEENPRRLDTAELLQFPFLYAVEVGYMQLSDAEVQGLRRYLLSGGFMVADDFWGTAEWQNFESEMRRVLPEYRIVELPLAHPLFHSFYDIREILQVPNVGQGIRGGRTWESDGYEPHCRGIFDDKGRLLVVINWNTDLGDAWEWAENPYYPLKFSTYAYEMGVNFIVYAMSH